MATGVNYLYKSLNKGISNMSNTIALNDVEIDIDGTIEYIEERLRLFCSKYIFKLDITTLLTNQKIVFNITDKLKYKHKPIKIYCSTKKNITLLDMDDTNFDGYDRRLQLIVNTQMISDDRINVSVLGEEYNKDNLDIVRMCSNCEPITGCSVVTQSLDKGINVVLDERSSDTELSVTYYSKFKYNI